jgi:putative acetyltransferase
MPSIRPARPTDRQRLLEVWLDSVRATHRFLSEAQVQSLFVTVRDGVLPNLAEPWVLCDDTGAVVGFMDLDGASLEALFIDPAYFRRGGASLLVAHARRLKGPLRVSVNEQNPGALAFYLATGFEVVGRAPVDDAGRPFPLLHLCDRTADRAGRRRPVP